MLNIDNSTYKTHKYITEFQYSFIYMLAYVKGKKMKTKLELGRITEPS